MNFVILNLRNMVPKKLTETELYALDCHMHDSASYGSADLLEGWTKSLLGETWLKILKSSARCSSWQERAPLHRKFNLLKDIEGNLANSNQRICQ